MVCFSAECSKKALGMESGSIADSQLLASSSFDAISVGPQNGRIRTEKASGAWCPKPQIREGSYEFLQVFSPTILLNICRTFST
ncbi:hypothetical protein AB6A40_007089 [Gnathostoma spinigerum]|uniref:F5/8 type C domain-containing protein n=1 Tax=Gnathostoma spinigerum TaxID=75299 RepID=A0ABD6ELF6_9BILA